MDILVFFCQRARPDIEPTVAYICTRVSKSNIVDWRVSKSNIVDWKKLRRLVSF